METITIQMSTGEIAVPAEMRGNLAIHQVRWDDGWRVTHIPTGCAIVIGIAERDDAFDCAAQLTELHSWDFKCEPQGAVPIIGEDLARRVREIGEACGGLVARRN